RAERCRVEGCGVVGRASGPSRLRRSAAVRRSLDPRPTTPGSGGCRLSHSGWRNWVSSSFWRRKPALLAMSAARTIWTPLPPPSGASVTTEAAGPDSRPHHDLRGKAPPCLLAASFFVSRSRGRNDAPLPSPVMRTLSADELKEHLASIQEDGYTVVEDAIEPDLV